MERSVRAALAMLLLAASGCSVPPADGSYARRQGVEIPIERFCACGAWPEEGCPPKTVEPLEAGCIDSVYATYPDPLRDYAACLLEARYALDECFLDGVACLDCRDRWAADTGRCPAIPLDVRRELDSCLTDF